MGILLFSCKTVKLSEAEEKQRIGEYYEAANMYRKLYSKAKPAQRHAGLRIIPYGDLLPKDQQYVTRNKRIHECPAL